MDFRNSYPDYVAIEKHIRRARLERSLAIAQMIAGGIDALWRLARKVGSPRPRLHSTPGVKRPVPAAR